MGSVEILDGDAVRTNLSQGLGFSKIDRDTNIRRIGWVCEILTRNDVVAIAAAISPYRDVRDEVRARIGRFVEVYLQAPAEVLAKRDPKGLYRQVKRGNSRALAVSTTRTNHRYMPRWYVIRTDVETPEQTAAHVIARLEELGYLSD